MTRKKYRSLVCAIAIATSFAPTYEGVALAAEETNAAMEAAQNAAGNTASSENAQERMEQWDADRPKSVDIAELIKSFEGKTIVDVEIDGASEKTLPTVQRAISTRPGDEFTASTLDKDLDAISSTGYFYDGYPSFTEVPEGIIISYHLMENPVVASIEITGNTVETTEDLRKLVSVKPGEILNRRALRESLQGIQALYRKDGYILAKVSNNDFSRDGRLLISINEGVVEGIKVKGNTKTKDYVILREMRTKIGEPLNAKQARRSQQRIYNLGFFQEVTLKPLAGVAPNAVELEVTVTEKHTGNFGLGVGYSNSDGFVGMISVGDTNFRGTGDAINILYEFSGDDEDAHGYQFMYRHPWMDKRETTGTIRIYNRTYRYHDYNTEGDLTEEYMRKYSGGELTFSRPVSEYSRNYLTLRNREDQYVKHYSGMNRSGSIIHNTGADRSDPAFDQWRKDNFGLTRSLIFEHVTDTRDNVFNPMDGGRVSLQGELAGFGGDFNFQKYSIEDQRYFKVGHAQVFALRAQYGRGNGHIPESNQYRLGGQNNLRGYRDDQFRGDNMCLGTLEYRFPVISKIQGALFTDWGSAWNGGWWPDDFHGSVGLGIQVQTPIGPIRLDYGEGSQGGRVHFSVGNTF